MNGDLKSRLGKIVHYKLFLPLFCLFLVLMVNVITTPDFFHVEIRNGVLYGRPVDIINRASELVILAVGMTLVVAASAGTDISVGAVMAVTAAVTTFFLSGGEISVNEYQFPLFLAILLGIGAGALCGAWNGFLVAKMRIQPMVATLILYTAGRGIAQLITKGQITYIRVDSYQYIGNFLPGVPIPTPVFISIAVVILVQLFVKKTAFGLFVESVGVNKEASKHVGLKSVMIIFATYVFCGVLSGIAGIVASSRIYSADANNIGLNLELDAILAVALGGNSLGGGRFSILGSIIGAYTIQALTTTLYAIGVSADQIPVYKAIVVVIIVSLQSPEFQRYVRKFRKKLEAKKAIGEVTA